MTKPIRTLLLLSAALSSVGCAAKWNGANQALTVAEQHPIAVDSQTVTMTLAARRDSLRSRSLETSRLRVELHAERPRRTDGDITWRRRRRWRQEGAQ